LFLILAAESEVLKQGSPIPMKTIKNRGNFGSFHQGKEHNSYYPFIIIKK
jgi:hypothetical protein